MNKTNNFLCFAMIIILITAAMTFITFANAAEPPSIVTSYLGRLVDYLHKGL